MTIHISDAFRKAFRGHPSGVAVIAADPGERPAAMTVSSLISVTADPPVVAFSLSSRSTSSAPILRARTMVIHLLQFSDLKLARLAATSGADRFSGEIPWERLPTGEPRYTDVATWFRARQVGIMPLEGATLVAAELLDGAVRPEGEVPDCESLVYLDREWHLLRNEINSRI